MRRSGTGSGGGYGSRNVKHVTEPKREPRARAINPGGVNMLGAMQGDHATNRPGSTGYRGEQLVRGPGYNAPVGPTNMALAGPGAGREVMRGGSQGQQGAPNPGSPQPAGRDILGAFGPKSKRG